MVTCPCAIHIFPCYTLAKYPFNVSNRFEDRYTVFPPPAHVVHFSEARILNDGIHCSHNVMAVDVIPYLLAPVTVYSVYSASNGHFYQVRQEAMQFHARMPRSGQASAPENTGFEIKITPIFLHHYI